MPMISFSGIKLFKCGPGGRSVLTNNDSLMLLLLEYLKLLLWQKNVPSDTISLSVEFESIRSFIQYFSSYFSGEFQKFVFALTHNGNIEFDVRFL